MTEERLSPPVHGMLMRRPSSSNIALQPSGNREGRVSGRLHCLDALRSGLMLLGIPFHASLIYSERNWSVSAGSSLELFSFIGGLINSFRMPAFFLIAGYLSLGAIQKRGGWPWLRRRTVRLGVPLFSSAIILNPIQMVAAAVNDAGYTTSWAELSRRLVDDLSTFGPHWIRHLWFLPALLVVSALFGVLWNVRFLFSTWRGKAF